MRIPRVTLAALGALAMLVLNAGVARASIGVIGSISTSTPGTPLERVENQGIAVDQSTGDLYAIEAGRNRVVKFDPAGIFILTFGREVNATKVREREEGKTISEAEENVCTAVSGDECKAGETGSGPGQFQELAGVVVAPSTGYIYVGDPNGTQEFDSEGGYLTRVGIDVGAVDTEGNLYTVPPQNEDHVSIYKYNSSVEYTGVQFVVGGHATSSVASIGVDAEGNLYATGGPTLNPVFRFAPSGTPTGVLEVTENEKTEGSLAVDLLNGDIFTFPVPGGEEEYRLVEYTHDGIEVASYPGYPVGDGAPGGMAFAAKTGRLYVVKRAPNSGSQAEEILIYGPFPVPAPQAPVISAEAVASEGTTSATLTARVNPELAETTYYFQYATSASFTGATDVPIAPAGIGSGFLPVGVSAEASGLAPSSTYYYRVVALSSLDGGVTVDGPAETLTTLAPAPAASTAGASEVSYDAATLNGTVLPGSVGAASDTRWCFEYGTGNGGGYNLGSLPLLPGDAGQGTTGVPVSMHLGDLAPGSTYRYRLVAVNSLGLGQESTACGTEGGHEGVGAQQTFTTPITFPAPVAVSGAASGVSQNAATISGSVDPDGVRTSYEFQLGLDTGYGVEVFGEAGTGSEPESFSLTLAHLQPDTTYHYRLVAISDGGTSYGADETFTTSGFPSAVLGAPATPPLLATPVFAFPTVTAVGGGRLAGKTKTKKKKGKRKARKTGRAGGPGHSGVGNGRGGR